MTTELTPLPDVVRTDECWDWAARRNKDGYSISGRSRLHRVAYRAFVGEIPEGLEIDHLCRNPPCFNPAHLEAVTHQENMRRGFWGMKTHCPQGHPYDAENTLMNSASKKGGRLCRTCKNAHAVAYRARKKSTTEGENVTTTAPTLAEILALTGPGLTKPMIYVTLAYSPGDAQRAAFTALRETFPGTPVVRDRNVAEQGSMTIPTDLGVHVMVVFKLAEIAELRECTHTTVCYVIDGQEI